MHETLLLNFTILDWLKASTLLRRNTAIFFPVSEDKIRIAKKKVSYRNNLSSTIRVFDRNLLGKFVVEREAT
jgi:hypothetical protein